MATKPFEPSEEIAAWAAECATPMADPAEHGALLDQPTRSYWLWRADRMLPTSANVVGDAKRMLTHLGYKKGRRDGVTRWKGVEIAWPEQPWVDSGGTLAVSSVPPRSEEADETDLYLGLGTMVRLGMVTPKTADLAFVHMTNVPYALCSGCGMLTHRVAERHHVGCLGKKEAS